MNNKSVICFEGVNNQIWKLISRLTDDQIGTFKAYCKRAEKYLGIDFYKIMLDGKVEDRILNSFYELTLTYISNCAICEYLIEEGIKPDAFLGYSLGVNSAIACSGGISFESGLKINQLLYKSMIYASKHHNYAMGLIVGVYEQFLYDTIKSLGYDQSVIDIASVNSTYSFLLVGEATAIEQVGQRALENGALLYNKIDSIIPFHFNLRASWLTDNVNQFEELPVHDLKYPVFSPYKLRLIEKEEVCEELIENVYKKIKWAEAIEVLEKDGFTNFIDVSITGSNKKISELNGKDSKFYNLKNYKSINLSR